MNIRYSHSIDGEPVFRGEIRNHAFYVIRVLTDIDYGWHPLSYLPGQSGGAAEQYWDEIECYLDQHTTQLMKAAR